MILNNILLYLLIGVSLIHHEKLLPAVRWEYTERPTSGHSETEEALEHSVLNGLSPSNPSLRGSVTM